jgi:hypothetical protein
VRLVIIVPVNGAIGRVVPLPRFHGHDVSVTKELIVTLPMAWLVRAANVVDKATSL